MPTAHRGSRKHTFPHVIGGHGLFLLPHRLSNPEELPVLWYSHDCCVLFRFQPTYKELATVVLHIATIMPLENQTKRDWLVRCKMEHAEKETEAVYSRL
jgi:hypothetical protein